MEETQPGSQGRLLAESPQGGLLAEGQMSALSEGEFKSEQNSFFPEAPSASMTGEASVGANEMSEAGDAYVTSDGSDDDH